MGAESAAKAALDPVAWRGAKAGVLNMSTSSEASLPGGEGAVIVPRWGEALVVDVSRLTFCDAHSAQLILESAGLGTVSLAHGG